MKLGIGFDCASMDEIKTMINFGVSPTKIIYANPCKQPNHIKFAYENGIRMMTFDNKDELFKIKDNHPTAQLVIRIHVDDSKSVCQLGSKFGVRIGNTKALLEQAKKLQLNVIGVSFHVGSGCSDAIAYATALKRASEVFAEAKELGIDMTLLDIGGGFPGLSGSNNGVMIQFEEIAEVIRNSMDEYFPQCKEESCPITLIAEPGRFFASSAFSLCANITSKRTIDISETEKSFMYYVNDGVYGSFNCLIFDHAVLPYPKFMIKNPSTGHLELKALKNSVNYNSSLWGPTCDSMDCLTKNIELPELNVGDWLIFENMGAYTLVAASKFNGMKKPKVFYINNPDSDKLLLKPSKIVDFVKPKLSLTKSDDDYS